MCHLNVWNHRCGCIFATTTSRCFLLRERFRRQCRHESTLCHDVDTVCEKHSKGVWGFMYDVRPIMSPEPMTPALISPKMEVEVQVKMKEETDIKAEDKVEMQSEWFDVKAGWDKLNRQREEMDLENDWLQSLREEIDALVQTEGGKADMRNWEKYEINSLRNEIEALHIYIRSRETRLSNLRLRDSRAIYELRKDIRELNVGLREREKRLRLRLRDRESRTIGEEIVKLDAGIRELDREIDARKRSMRRRKRENIRARRERREFRGRD